MNGKLTIAGAHGAAYCNKQESGLRRYVDSLSHLTDCDHVVFSNELAPWLEALLAERGVRVVYHRIWGDFVLACQRDRLRFVREECRGYQTIIHTDMRDLFFQADVPHLSGLNLIAEGMQFQHSGWNQRDMQKLVHAKPPASLLFEEWPVLNGGVQIGSPDALADFYEAILPYMEDHPRFGYSDQAVANYLVHRLGWPATVHHPETSDLCLTGEACALRIRDAPMNERGQYVDKLGRPYRIVHQLDRVPSKAVA
jgi:hypothetical protein